MVVAFAPFRESVASPGQQIAIGRLSALTPGPVEASGGNPRWSPRSTQVYFLIVFFALCGRGNRLLRIVHKVLDFAKPPGTLASERCQRPRPLSILVSVR